MPENITPYHKAAKPNPALHLLNKLIGEWDTTATHPLSPNTVFRGRTICSWVEGGSFFRMSSVSEESETTGVPSSISIVGSDDHSDVCFMLYVDERGVSRKYDMSLQGGVWKMWRNAPKFSQRFTGTFSEDGDTIVGVWELNEDDFTWQRDLAITYVRVK